MVIQEDTVSKYIPAGNWVNADLCCSERGSAVCLAWFCLLWEATKKSGIFIISAHYSLANHHTELSLHCQYSSSRVTWTFWSSVQHFCIHTAVIKDCLLQFDLTHQISCIERKYYSKAKSTTVIERSYCTSFTKTKYQELRLPECCYSISVQKPCQEIQQEEKAAPWIS